MDINIFDEKGKFSKFVENSILQYIKLKFGNKDKLISCVESDYGIKIAKNADYNRISTILEENSKDFYRDVLKVGSPIEAAHLYSFYKVLTDIYWGSKTFSPIYKFLFNEEIKIRKKSELRKYASKIITEFNHNDLTEKWMELASSGDYEPVIHYTHLTMGPVGLLFSLHYREKEILGRREPILAVLVDRTPTGEYIIDWEGTDAFRVFSFILEEINKKVPEVYSKYPVYAEYLTLIGFEFSYTDWKKELLNFVKSLKNEIKDDKIPIMLYQIIQICAMFFKDDEILDLLNKLIAENKLIINSKTEIEDLRITNDGIIKKPKSWLAKPAFDLANDIASIEYKSSEKDFREPLTAILKVGTIKYLEQMFDNNFETFRAVCAKRSLYKFALFDRFNLPKDYAIRLLLESYGLLTPLTISFEIRKNITLFLKKLKDFKDNYKELVDYSLVNRMQMLLGQGRTCFERLLKEWLYIIISLILYYEDSESKNGTKDIFILDRPIFYIWRYNREYELDVKKKYRGFLGRLGTSKNLKVSAELEQKISKYIEKGKIEFGLNDWYFLTKISINYIDENYGMDFWELLPTDFYRNINVILSEVEKFFSKEEGLKWLNIGSHEESMVKFRENIDNRRKALNILLRLDEMISSVLKGIAELIIITEKVTEARTGLEYYKAEFISDKSVLKLYGTRFVELEFSYYFIPRFERRESIITYPILITNLVDTVF